jgi:hypothetical protein
MSKAEQDLAANQPLKHNTCQFCIFHTSCVLTYPTHVKDVHFCQNPHQKNHEVTPTSTCVNFAIETNPLYKHRRKPENSAGKTNAQKLNSISLFCR